MNLPKETLLSFTRHDGMSISFYPGVVDDHVIQLRVVEPWSSEPTEIEFTQLEWDAFKRVGDLAIQVAKDDYILFTPKTEKVFFHLSKVKKYYKYLTNFVEKIVR
jgi:predicted methyltransferase